MPVEPPPSRYRVIERGRRLEVIDTQARARTPHYVPEAELPAVESVPEEPAAFDPAPGEPWSEPPAPPVTAAEPAMLVDRAPPRPGTASPPELFTMIATTICGDTRDGDGRLVLTTARFYDARAPRRIALDREGERWVAGAALGLLAGAVLAIIFALSIGWFGLILLVLAGSFLKQFKTVTTPALDRLAARAP